MEAENNMSNWKVTPSTAYTVRSDTSISECVRIMRQHGFGSILVADASKALIGIFTERDLLKWINEIQHGGHWDSPIALLMSKPVHTLTIDELDQAAEVMIDRNVRHIPIMHVDPATGKNIAGVVSMRDLFREMVSHKKARESTQRQLRAGMISQTEAIRHLIRKLCARQGNLMVETITVDVEIKSLLKQVHELDYLFFDLDEIDAKVWIAILKELNALEIHPEVFLLYDSDKHPEAELELLAKLSLSKRFSAYMKPLNIFTILNKMS